MTDTPDSFIEEVTEELRRDRLFAAFRKYGWIGILAIVLIVGWSAWQEYSAARHEARAQAFGDAIGAALAMPDPAARTVALAAVPVASADQQAVLTLLTATDAAGVSQLAALAASPDVPQVYRDLANFRRLLLAAEMDPGERMAEFVKLAVPGNPFRLLAEEQVALIEIGMGESAAAIGRLQALSEDTEASAALRQRAAQLIVSLGGEVAESVGSAGMAGDATEGESDEN